MNSIGDDNLTDILGRLPFESLIRCKCVCRSWHSLLSGEPLRRKLALVTSAILHHRGGHLDEEHRSYACTSIAAAGGGSGQQLVEFDLSFVPSHRKLTILDSCNGLLLCRNTRVSSGPFHVINPLAGTWSALAKHPRDSCRVLLPILIFDPRRSSEQFKVATFSAWSPRGAELEVFSSETMAWTEHGVQWPEGITSDALTTTVRYFDGAIHIIARPNHVVCMDLAGMTCRRIKLPEPATYTGSSFLGKSGGYLCYYAHDFSDDEMRIWKLEERSNELRWRLDYKTSKRRLYSLLSGSRAGDKPLRFLGFHPGRKMIYLWLEEKLVALDMREESCEVIFASSEGVEPIQIWVFPFMPSLVQLN